MDRKLLQQLLEEIREIKSIIVTKDDAKSFLTKEDAKNFLTKEDAKNFLTKEDAKNFVTKEDLNVALAAVEKRLTKEIREAETFAIVTADKHKAEKAVVEDHEKRLVRIERKFAA